MEFVTVLFLVYVLAFWPWGMWDLNPPTRHWAHALCVERWNHNCWNTEEVTLGNFELTGLLTVVTVRSSELTLLISGSLHPLTCISHFYLLSSPGNQHVCFYEISFLVFIFFLQIPHVSDSIQYLSFSVWLISLTIEPPRLIHVITNSRISMFYG